ncbi:DUF6412 domain-containing protein [Micromonospora auratinigra]|uniref:Uncharacterized protein n=1 Tax=Micromonospora auratinigra TaxID=261654 RepID=A0A1A8ZSM3_9ACTN|nr:DUF6412 domain-containing protein [Micromonospora auratinigra]SBT46869.1 hypothetical protein GA0070611_3528 [Micromonospora auratinigra]
MAGVLATVTGLWAYALGHLALLVERPGGLLAGAAVVAAALLLATLLALRSRALPGAPRSARAATAWRARSRGRRVPRQADPDAAGRPRPRAPGHHPSVA